MSYIDAENRLVELANDIASLEYEDDLEYIRLVQLGENTFVANTKARLANKKRLAYLRAEHDIVLARLRR